MRWRRYSRSRRRRTIRTTLRGEAYVAVGGVDQPAPRAALFAHAGRRRSRSARARRARARKRWRDWGFSGPEIERTRAHGCGVRLSEGPSGFGAWRMVGWGAALLLTAFHAWMLNRYAVNFPTTADDFTQLLAVPGYVEHTPTFVGKLAYLLSLSVDHRIVTLRAMALRRPWVLAAWISAL